MAENSALGLLVAFVLPVSGCVAPRYSDHQFVGAKPCPVSRPIDTKNCLSTKADKPVGLLAAILGCLTTPFKAAGISGWTDYHCNAEAVGRVVQSRLSTDRFFTVDIALRDMRVDQTQLEKVSGRYIRAEIYQDKTPVPRASRTLCRPSVFIRGKLVWDSDGCGHLEIHPQHPNDYAILLAP
jgi:hypothetical protein